MKVGTLGGVFALAVRTLSSAGIISSDPYRRLHLEGSHTLKPCRVPVCFSGHIRSFVHPVVHQSIRKNLLEKIAADGCRVDVFAYASLEAPASERTK